MKKVFFIYICIGVVFIVNAQDKLSGSLGTYTYNNIGNRYTNLNWEVSYKFEKKNDGIYLKYYNPKVTVASNSQYATSDKNYSKAELGLSVWPQSYSPSSLNVNVDCRLPDGKAVPLGFAFSTSDPYKTHETWVFATTYNGKETDLLAFTLSVMKAHYIPQPVKELDDIINQKKSQEKTSIPNSDVKNYSSNEPTINESQSTDKPNIDQKDASYNLKYSDVGIPENTPTYTKAEATTQIVSNSIGLATDILNDLNANYDKKMARLQAESDARILKGVHEAQSVFKEKYLPLLDRAKAGDESIQMILYFASKVYYSTNDLRDRNKWLNEALRKDNTDALIEKAVLECEKISFIGCKEGNRYLEKAAALGSADAMVLLGIWYDFKTTKYASHGEDPIQALDWFQKAAEKGNPAAMYFLGMIYKYGKTDNSNSSFLKVRYKIEPNEQTALEWFKKALNQNYELGLFSRSRIYNGDYLEYKKIGFIKETFIELSKFYKKGKLVPKDLEMVKRLENNYKEYKNYNGF